MTIHIGRYVGHVTIHSTATGRIATATHDEWVGLVERIKSGALDYTLTPSRATRAPDLSDVLRERIKADACPTCGSTDRNVKRMTGCGFPCDDPSGWHLVTVHSTEPCRITYAHSAHRSPGFAPCPGVDR